MEKLIVNTSWSFALKAQGVLVGCDGGAHVIVQKYRRVSAVLDKAVGVNRL
jgi:hypothetical protein